MLFAGWVNHQRDVIEYPLAENRVLKEQLRGRKLRFSDDQRRRLAARGVTLGRELLAKVATIVTPDTILAWHRKLIARKWATTAKRPGRPLVMKNVRALVVRMAKENRSWGYARLRGGLRNVGLAVAQPSASANRPKRRVWVFG